MTYAISIPDYRITAYVGEDISVLRNTDNRIFTRYMTDTVGKFTALRIVCEFIDGSKLWHVDTSTELDAPPDRVLMVSALCPACRIALSIIGPNGADGINCAKCGCPIEARPYMTYSAL